MDRSGHAVIDCRHASEHGVSIWLPHLNLILFFLGNYARSLLLRRVITVLDLADLADINVVEPLLLRVESASIERVVNLLVVLATTHQLLVKRVFTQRVLPRIVLITLGNL